MSNGKKYPGELAAFHARTLMEELRPCCERIEMVGSLRRQKLKVFDMELLFVPRIEKVPGDLFSTVDRDLAEAKINEWLATGVIEKRLAETGKLSSWGPLNKHAIHLDSGIPLDLFAEPDLKDWWRSLVIRTGPREFNVELMATAPKVGIIPHAYGAAMYAVNGERVLAESEEDFIRKCGMKYLPPAQR